jgi:uncharacterized protein
MQIQLLRQLKFAEPSFFCFITDSVVSLNRCLSSDSIEVGMEARPNESTLLRIFTGDKHRFHHRPLFEAIVLKARDLKLAGATVLHGTLGFGKSSRLHQANPLRLSSDLPVVIEIVDSSEKISSFLPILEEMMPSGLITMEKAQIVDLFDEG